VAEMAMSMRLGLAGSRMMVQAHAAGTGLPLEITASAGILLYAMDTPTESMRKLAKRLLAVEAANQSASYLHVHEAVRLSEKLRISLTRFAGPDGFAALLRWALALASADVPALQTVKVKPDGSIEGLEEIAADASNGGAEAAAAITAHLLGLLVTFIGEPLTLGLVREAWPDALLDE
jgi:hypothetical protein